jgi:hypothetical protein
LADLNTLKVFPPNNPPTTGMLYRMEAIPQAWQVLVPPAWRSLSVPKWTALFFLLKMPGLDAKFISIELSGRMVGVRRVEFGMPISFVVRCPISAE